MSKIKVTLRKSLIGRLQAHKSCVKGLGIRKINHTVTVEDTPENLGMINKVKYMLEVEKIKWDWITLNLIQKLPKTELEEVKAQAQARLVAGVTKASNQELEDIIR